MTAYIGVIISHTDKDEPYWVRLNHEGVFTDHDHTRFGKEITRMRRAKDADGNLIEIDIPIYRSVHSVLFGGWHDRGTDYRPEDHYPPDVINAARKVLYASGTKTWEQVQIGIRRGPKYEKIVIGHVKDYCTAGEAIPKGESTWGGTLPCTPELPRGPRYWGCNCISCSARRKEGRRVREGHLRAASRATLTKFAKLYNTGEDIEDFDYEESRLHDRGIMEW